MPDLEDGQSTTMQGSGTKLYVLKNVGVVFDAPKLEATFATRPRLYFLD